MCTTIITSSIIKSMQQIYVSFTIHLCGAVFPLSMLLIVYVYSAMEEEELQVALAISASLTYQESSCHEVFEISRLA